MSNRKRKLPWKNFNQENVSKDNINRWKIHRKDSNQFISSVSGWYEISVPNVEEHCITPCLEQIQLIVEPLILRAYRVKKETNNNGFSFFIDNHEVAEKIYLQRTIKTATGRYYIHINRSRVPKVLLNLYIEKIKCILNKRFSRENNAMDLSNFHCDPEFLTSNDLVPLSRPNVFTHVFNQIRESYPDLLILNLNSNKIFDHDSLINIGNATPRLQVLYLNNNNIQFTQTLEQLRSLSQLKQLHINNNPIITSNNLIENEIETILPQLIQCNEIIFHKDNLHNFVFSPSRNNFLCYEQVEPICKRFIEIYFNKFDNHNRKELINMYDENAQFSMTAVDGKGRKAQIGSLIKFSRNLLRDFISPDLLPIGKHNIVNYLQSLPETKHDIKSFLFDCPIFTTNLVQFTIHGLFQQLNDLKTTKRSSHVSKLTKASSYDNYKVRYFSRTFLFTIKPNDFIIISNDQLFITPATPDQYLQIFENNQIRSKLNSLKCDHDSEYGEEGSASANRMNIKSEYEFDSENQNNVKEDDGDVEQAENLEEEHLRYLEEEQISDDEHERNKCRFDIIPCDRDDENIISVNQYQQEFLTQEFFSSCHPKNISQERQSFQTRSSHHRRPRCQQTSSRQEHTSHEKPFFNSRPSSQEKPPFDSRSSSQERQSFQLRSSFHTRSPFSQMSSRQEHTSYEKASFNSSSSSQERPPFQSTSSQEWLPFHSRSSSRESSLSKGNPSCYQKPFPRSLSQQRIRNSKSWTSSHQESFSQERFNEEMRISNHEKTSSPNIQNNSVEFNFISSLVQNLCSKTKMNSIYSKKLLTEVNWNMNRAIIVFEELKKTNSIPAEAFVLLE